MKLATIRQEGRTHAVRIEGDEAVLVDAPDVGSLLHRDDWRTVAAATGERVPLAGLDIGPLVVRPTRIVCVGLNYAGHIREMGRELPTSPTLFSKFASALTGPYDDIDVPVASTKVDWEAELAVVIGTAGRDIDPVDALDHVAGYTVLNDVSMRDWQNRTTQWLAGKSWDGSTPIGPVLVTADELPAGAAGLRITCEVDGEVMQDDNTADLLFDVAHLIADISVMTRLEPGDVIATGTPNGVGAGRTPQVFLQPGQVMRTRIEGIGELINRIIAPV